MYYALKLSVYTETVLFIFSPQVYQQKGVFPAAAVTDAV